MTNDRYVEPQTTPSLDDNIELGFGITQLDAEYMHPGVAALYLLQVNDRIAIIDTGTSYTVPAIMQTLADRNLDVDAVDYVIPTHVHLDHAGGVGELMHHCRQAQLVVHPYGARHMINPEKLQAGSIAVYGETAFRQHYGQLRPVCESRVIEAPDGFELDFEGRVLRFVDTPGHARHHFCIYDKISRGIFTGDAFGLHYPALDSPGDPFIFATTTPVQFDPEAMIASIDRLMRLKPLRLYLTHFGCVQASRGLAEQLKHTVRDFHDLALRDVAASHTNSCTRQARLEKSLMDYLMQRLKDRHCPLSEQTCRELLQMDVVLNAQGLDVWLTRNFPA